MKKIELTLNKADLLVTGDNLDKLIFDNNGKSQVITENDETLTLTKEEVGGKASYTVTGYKKDGDNEVTTTAEIKDKLFDKDNKESKKITVFSEAEIGELHNIATQAAFYHKISI